MGMTMTQKILAAHAGEASVKAGQLIQAKLDIVMGNDITTAVALKEFQKTGAKEVLIRIKVVIRSGSLYPQQGHQGGRAVQGLPYLCL